MKGISEKEKNGLIYQNFLWKISTDVYEFIIFVLALIKLFSSIFQRVVKITPNEVVFSTEGTSFIYSVQCWRIQGNTKTKTNVTSITLTRINQSIWVQCGVDIKTGYEYEFLFATDRAEDSTITIKLPGKIDFFWIWLLINWWIRYLIISSGLTQRSKINPGYQNHYKTTVKD